ncbi:MAG: 16S rRNA (cytosine(1402)-N(4))-methyltransferase RsmH [Candidatus Paceibacterota bacterium]|jgi:16S rRNA (cytosine1402-N4)-methyltransferase
MTHTTVLLHEAIDGLNLKQGSVYFDGTLGAGGHASEVARRFGGSVRIVGVDRDLNALEYATKRVQALGVETHFMLGNFRNVDSALVRVGVTNADAILMDLGWNSSQIEESGRGFSFKEDEALLMTFSTSGDEGGVNAQVIVNEWSEETLADIFYGYADERYARRIAKAIVTSREKKPIKTTYELVEIIRNAVPKPYTWGKIHFATRTFQALRIAVNDEIEALKEGLEKSYATLNTQGRIVIISFHSVEDRVVKQMFKQWMTEGKGIVITKKPLVPSKDEIKINPRSRSAKLRIFQKI